jgi:hypothetical protein
MLTGEQRYRQAHVKARIIRDREMVEFMAGDRGWLECSTDRERDFIIQELDRAFQKGFAAGMAAAMSSQERQCP